MINPEPSLKEFKKFEAVRIEAHALRGLPADSIRFHICWGSWHGPTPPTFRSTTSSTWCLA